LCGLQREARGHEAQIAAKELGGGASWVSLSIMTHALRATVKAGRLVLDEPIDLPEGTIVDLVPVEQGDDLDDEDRARLHAALARSQEDFSAGRGILADQVLAELRAKANRRRTLP
jgi:hypothetical protein